MKKQKLTTSEARAEAATIVLQILLRSRLSDEEYARYYAAARLAGADLGLPDISDEVAWLFLDDRRAEADMLLADDRDWAPTRAGSVLQWLNRFWRGIQR